MLLVSWVAVFFTVLHALGVAAEWVLFNSLDLMDWMNCIGLDWIGYMYVVCTESRKAVIGMIRENA